MNSGSSAPLLAAPCLNTTAAGAVPSGIFSMNIEAGEEEERKMRFLENKWGFLSRRN